MLLYRVILGTKKSPPVQICIKDERKNYAVVPPCFARFLTEAAFESADTLLRCDGRSPVAAYASAVGHATPRPCSPDPSAPLFTVWGLSVPYRSGYSSLHRLCDSAIFGCAVICTTVYPLSLSLSTEKTNQNAPALCYASWHIFTKSAGRGRKQRDFFQECCRYRIETRGQNCYHTGV